MWAANGELRSPAANGGSGFENWFPDADKPDGSETPRGGAVIAPFGPDEFLVAGQHAPIAFKRAGAVDEQTYMIVSGEEGALGGDQWRKQRVWNGDQTDYGLNFTDWPQIPRVRMAEH